MEKKLRLDKYLADMKVGSRAEVKQIMKKGRITVDGVIVKKPETKIQPGLEEVCADGKPVGYVSEEYWMLNKPAGVISATEDHHCETVVDLLKEKSRKDLFPVGRLDKDTEGLLLLTNDGALAHALLSPKKHVDKTYFAKIEGEVTKEDQKAFLKGVDIGEDRRTMPADLEILSSGEGRSEIRLTIREGKFHQVKRMFEAVGKKVTYLKRLTMGSLVLDENLKTGEARRLTEEEIRRLKTGRTAAWEQKDDRDQEKDQKIEAAIFDLDGTLVDSMWVWKSVDVDFLGQFGQEVPETLQDELEGMSFTETACYFKKRFPFLPFSVEQLKEIWNQLASEKYAHEVPLKPGVKEFLVRLKEHGIKTGVASSNSKELVVISLKNLGVYDYFDTIRTACEVKKGKPAPDIYLLAAEDLKVKPERCIIFEDVPAGILAGAGAGMHTCAVADRYSEYLKDEKIRLADRYIEDFFELLPDEE